MGTHCKCLLTTLSPLISITDRYCGLMSLIITCSVNMHIVAFSRAETPPPLPILDYTQCYVTLKLNKALASSVLEFPSAKPVRPDILTKITPRYKNWSTAHESASLSLTWHWFNQFGNPARGFSTLLLV